MKRKKAADWQFVPDSHVACSCFQPAVGQARRVLQELMMGKSGVGILQEMAQEPSPSMLLCRGQFSWLQLISHWTGQERERN